MEMASFFLDSDEGRMTRKDIVDSRKQLLITSFLAMSN
jgi:hypothetical protein